MGPGSLLTRTLATLVWESAAGEPTQRQEGPKSSCWSFVQWLTLQARWGAKD